MLELRALLQGIAEHPADDVRRHILADWLEEHNFLEGELLRTALSYRGWEFDPVYPHPFRKWLAAALPRLLPLYEPLRSRGVGYAINCALVDEVELSTFQLARCGRWLSQLYPVRSIRFRWDPHDSRELAAAQAYPLLNQLCECTIDPLQTTDTIPLQAYQQLLDLPLFEPLRRLVIFFHQFDRVAVRGHPLLENLLRKPFRQLKRLRLIGLSSGKAEFLQQLTQTRLAQQLILLDLDDLYVPDPDDFLTALNALPSSLRVVHLRWPRAQMDDLEALHDALAALQIAWAKVGRELHLNLSYRDFPLDDWREALDPFHAHIPGSNAYWQYHSWDDDLQGHHRENEVSDLEEATQYGRIFPSGTPDTPTRREENRGRFRNPRRDK